MKVIIVGAGTDFEIIAALRRSHPEMEIIESTLNDKGEIIEASAVDWQERLRKVAPDLTACEPARPSFDEPRNPLESLQRNHKKYKKRKR